MQCRAGNLHRSTAAITVKLILRCALRGARRQTGSGSRFFPVNLIELD